MRHYCRLISKSAMKAGCVVLRNDILHSKLPSKIAYFGGFRARVRNIHTSLAASHNAGAEASRSTVNADEIAHFSKLSSSWWDEQGEFAQLHRMNPVRVQFIREKLIETAYEDNLDTSVSEYRVLDSANVLDVGCGGGVLSESLARLGANTLGIDATPSNIRIASLHASADPGLPFGSDSSSDIKGQGRLSYRTTTVEELLATRGPGIFDVVCSMEVLEHVDNPRVFLSSCAQLVKPGGHLFLSTIARTPFAYLLTIFAAENALRLVAPGTHTYSKYIIPEELEGFFREYRLPSNTRPWITGPTGVLNRTEAEVRGMMYLPWRGEWTLGPRSAKWSQQCNYLFWVRRPLE